ncbi:TOG array regulator of axonemal microtubules protein 1 [Impatiens glandulifera]|uniref:TOG array regulator of axonemal microtubules protein 1 n=1 Tax=Impatiens glandulifera TaxID=253017 RepID=UPI001FB1873D|nr:TOG array regulator of axonemal microtubules protein 1 [Impatiens glandulifera]
MALRSLDNALPLPTTSERPKKQAKVTIPTQKQSADENTVPLPETETAAATDASIDYISSENLNSLTDPDIKIQTLIDELESKDWLKVCDSLNDVRRFALFHSNLLLPILGRIMLILVKTLKNPRSALCKTSIMTSSDIFTSFNQVLLNDPTISDSFDALLLQLLLKASQDKKFVCEEADKTLNIAVKSMSPLPLLHKLRTYVTHSNMRIRAKVAVTISNCISKMGVEEMKEFGLQPMIKLAAVLLNDRLPAAREAARSIVMSVYGSFTAGKEEKDEEEEEEKEESSWQVFCQSNLTAIDAQSMIKIVSLSKQ